MGAWERLEAAPVIETQNLTKRYGPIVAVDALNLTVRQGEIFGFLGPNGAGKTTTLRMLLGLIRPTAGSARVLGQPPGAPAGLARIGTLLESAFYPYLSGRRNLQILARYIGTAESRVERVLEMVRMRERAGDPFKTYSLGMKQRLGVAGALLKNPDLLILDEPTNGLDPQGMAEMRELIRDLGQGTRTVLLSSHLLNEVQQICDRVGIIQGGKLVTEAGISELRGEPELLIRAAPLDKAREIVTAMVGSEHVHVNDGTLTLVSELERTAEINRRLVAADIDVTELRPVSRSLEDVYMELTGTQGVVA